MHRLKAAVFLMLIGFGVAGTLSGCILEEDRDGGRHHEHHDRD